MAGVLFTCPFVPPEWIVAHDLTPRRIMPRSSLLLSPPAPGAGVCPFAAAFVREAGSAVDVAAVVITTMCDQMRRASELIAASAGPPVFVLNVPATWTTAAAGLYTDELRRLGRFLCRVGGRAASDADLFAAMTRYDQARAAFLAVRPSLSPRAYADGLRALLSDGRCPSVEPDARLDGIPIALLGGPLFQEDRELFDVAERAGLRIVLDASEAGERTWPRPFDPRQASRDPLAELSAAYFEAIPDAFRRPDSKLYEWLAETLPARGVRGVLFRRMVWCDTWAAEAPRLRAALGVPMLEIDAVGDEDASQARLAGRLQAFAEMLS